MLISMMLCLPFTSLKVVPAPLLHLFPFTVSTCDRQRLDDFPLFPQTGTSLTCALFTQIPTNHNLQLMFLGISDIEETDHFMPNLLLFFIILPEFCTIFCKNFPLHTLTQKQFQDIATRSKNVAISTVATSGRVSMSSIFLPVAQQHQARPIAH